MSSLRRNSQTIRVLRKNAELVLYVAPAFLFMLVLILIPLFRGVQYSLYKWNGISITRTYVGLRNFIQSFDDDKFISSITFTLLYTVVNLVLVNIVALVLANILSMKLRSGGFLRTLFFSPNVISLVVIGMVWLFIFSTIFVSVAKATGLSFLNINWFGEAFWARLALIIVTQWITSGYLMLIYIAGIKSIDVEILEASIIDGSRGLSNFFRIKLPLLMPSVVISVFWITIYSLKLFDLPFVITAGGPYSSTETIPVNIYYSAFSFSRYGYASAKSIILLVLIVIITFLEVSYLKRREIEQ